MAILNGSIKFVGAIEGLSAYKMRGSDNIILRRKGGASKKKIKNSPNFKNTRLNNAEFGACSNIGKSFRYTMRYVSHMADFNISGPINAIMKMIQKLDSHHEWGKRAIYISQNKAMLEGFNLNKSKIFDSVLRCGIEHQIEREKAKATVYLPEIWTHLHLYNPENYALYRIIICMGLLSDYEFNESMNKYYPLNEKDNEKISYVQSEWQATTGLSPNNVLELEIQNIKTLTENDTLVLSIGIEFGYPLTNKLIQPIKYSGSAKILALA